MSLLVWLPLDGDTHNQGIAPWNFSVSNTSMITVDNSGKIGKCYNFNSTAANNGIYSADNGFMGTYINNKSWSICAWVCTSSTDTCVISLSYGLRIFCGNSTYVSLYNSSRTVTCTSSVAVKDGKWHHICATYDKDSNIITFYVDGVSTKTTSYTSGYIYASSWTNGLFIGRDPNNSTVSDHYLYKGKMNDLRIYGKALSAAEVKEISQGLILHYKLDDRYMEDSVYLSSEITGTAYNASNGKYSYNATSNLAKTTGFFHGKNCVKVYTLQAGSNAQPYSYFSNLYTSDGTNAPEYKALSFDYYTTCPTTTWLNIYKLGSGSGTATWKTISSVGTRTGTYTNSSNSILVQPNEWNHIEVIFHGTTNANAEWGYCINGPAHVANADYYFLYANIQLEQSDHTTGFNKDFHKGRITDSSGYDHYGIVNDTTLTVVPTTARYEYSMRNNQASNSSIYPFKGICNIPASSALTFSWWMNPSTIGNQTSGIFSTSNNNRPTDYQSTAVNMYDSCFSCCNTSGTCVRLNVASYLTVNVWHHYALVYNGSSLIFYKDGVQKTTIAQTGDLKAFAYIFPFYSEAGGAYRCTSGYLSDFRMYVTALSVDDIKALYNVGASIDNKQNLHTYEIREQDNSVIQLLKTGVLLEDELIESDSTQFKSNKIVETNEIIEI